MEKQASTVAELLSEAALAARYENLSEKNIRIAKDKLLDNIGNLAGGAAAFGNREVMEVVSTYGEAGEAPVFLLGGRCALGDAAMVNAMSSRSNDFEPMFMNLDGVRMPSKESATLINAARQGLHNQRSGQRGSVRAYYGRRRSLELCSGLG